MKSEDRIQQDMKTWLWNTYPETRKCLFHVPNQGKRSKLEAIRLKNMGVVAGIPDLIFAWKGKIYGIEVKTEDGYQSPDQKEIEAIWTAAGNPYFVVRTLEEFQDIILPILSHVNTYIHA